MRILSLRLLETCFLSVMVLASIVLQIYGMEPCVLCWLQRGIVCLMLLCSICIYISADYVRVLRMMQMGLCLMGVLLSLRHIYLQYGPPQAINNCLPSFGFLWKQGAYQVLLDHVWRMPGCHEVHAAFLQLSLPVWLLLAYLFWMVVWFFLIRQKQ